MTAADLAATLARLEWGASSLARLTGYTRQGVQQWLIGRRPVPARVAAWLERRTADLDRDPPPGR